MSTPVAPPPPPRRHYTMSSEMGSILLALIFTLVGVLLFLVPNYTPTHDSIRGIPGWAALGYITVQLWLLLDSALRVRPTSIIDAVLAIVPVIAGIVCFVLYLVGFLHLSLFQLNALFMMTITGLVEFVSTLWVRNVVLQRGLSVLPTTGA